MSEDRELPAPVPGVPLDTTEDEIRRLHDSLLPRDPFYGLVDLDKPSAISDADLEMIMSKSKLMAKESVTILTGTLNNRDPFERMYYSKALTEHPDNTWAWIANPADKEGPVTIDQLKRREQGTLIERDWGGGIHYPEQAVSRVLRHRLVNAVILPGLYASRNQREGHYNFKVKGRHARKRKPNWPKIITMRIGDKFWESINGRIEKKRSNLENGT